MTDIEVLRERIERLERAVFDPSGLAYVRGVKEFREKRDAIQKQGADEGGVRGVSGAHDEKEGEGVGEGNSKP